MWQEQLRDEPLVLLSMAKAESAEKACMELRSEVTMLDRQCQRTAEEVEKQLGTTQEAGRQHWERIVMLSSQVESMAGQRSGACVHTLPPGRKRMLALHLVDIISLYTPGIIVFTSVDP